VQGPREIARSTALYGRSAVRVARRGRRLGSEERIVFVVGSPRSGTSFTGRALGSLPTLLGAPDEEIAPRLRRILQRVRSLALARGLRGVEQTPETSFVLGAALRAYPEAVAVHVVRDGRDVATSLLERGWLSAERTGADDARLPFGPHARFWVEPGREEEFGSVSDATRAAWAWRRYVTAAAAVPARTVVVRYEQLVADPAGAAAPVAAAQAVDADLVTAAFAEAHDTSAGRWRRDLTPEQLADVEREAGDALAALGYA
jgi:hypothetical protein